MIDETVVGSKRKAAKGKKPAKKVAAKSNGKSHGKVQVKRGSGLRIRELLAKGKDTEEILTVIHKEFPGSKAKACDVSWNRGFADRAKATKSKKKSKK